MLYAVDVDLVDGKAVPRAGHIEPELSEEASVYSALVLGVRDYVSKHRFPGVVLGLSGGIDSALTLAIAVDALGADRVHAVMMPSRYTSQMSLDDAAQQARTLGVGYDVISIEGMFEAALGALQGSVRGPRAGHDRREHPGALPRPAADGDLEQDRPHGAHDRQQERDGCRLRDACTATWPAASRRSRTAARCSCTGSRTIATRSRR